MKQNFWTGLAALAGALLLAGAALAEINEHHEMKIMVMADGDELIEADIDDLAVGESRSLVSESGKTVDIIRTAEGIDLYIDGELQELEFDIEGLHGEHRLLHADVDVECGGGAEGDCTHDYVFISSDDGYEYEYGGDNDLVVIRNAIEIVCDDGEDCADLHDGEMAHKVIRVKRKNGGAD